MQAGSYASMVANATGLLDGQLQIQHLGFLDDPRIETTVAGVAARLEQVRADPDVVAATPRIEAFVLASGQDRSFGAQLFGVDPQSEAAVSRVPKMISAGRYLSGGSEAYAGEMLARNLGVAVGDEVVLLGSASTGGVAALAVTLVGTFSTGTAEFDRQLIEVPIQTVADAFDMNDAAHAIVVRTTSVRRAHAVAERLRHAATTDEVVLEWPALIPDLQQSIMLDQASGTIMYGVLAAVVTIGVLNGFLMIVFERTREFGMLLAMGMRARTVVGMLQLEAGALGMLGCLLGLAVGVPLVIWVGHVGIPLGVETGAAMRAFHVADRLYPTLEGVVALKPIVLMLCCTQVAALLPALRVLRIQPVEALRAA